MAAGNGLYLIGDGGAVQLAGEILHGAEQVVPAARSAENVILLALQPLEHGVGEGVDVSIAPDAVVAKGVGVVDEHPAGRQAAHAQAGKGALLRIGGDVVVRLDLLEDQLLLGPDAIEVEVHVLIVHGHDHELLRLAGGDQVIHDVGHCALAHPAQLVAHAVAGGAVGQVEHRIGLGAVGVIARGEIHGQAALLALRAGVGNGLHRAAVGLGSGILHAAVGIGHAAHGARIVGHVDHGGQAADAGGGVPQLRVVRVVLAGEALAVHVGDREVIHSRAARERNLRAPEAVAQIRHVLPVGGGAGAARGIQTGHKFVRLMGKLGAAVDAGALGNLVIPEEHHAVGIQLHGSGLAHGVAVVALLLLEDEGGSVAGGRIGVGLDGHAGLIALILAAEEEVLRGVGQHERPGMPVVAAGHHELVGRNADRLELGAVGVHKPHQIVPVTIADLHLRICRSHIFKGLIGKEVRQRAGPDAVISEHVRMIGQDPAGGDAAHAQAGVGLAGGLPADIVVGLHIGHDLLGLGPEARPVVEIDLVIHGDDDEGLDLTLGNEIVHDVRGGHLVHPAQLVALQLCLRAV